MGSRTLSWLDKDVIGESIADMSLVGGPDFASDNEEMRRSASDGEEEMKVKAKLNDGFRRETAAIRWHLEGLGRHPTYDGIRRSST